jgi:3-oxoacyl-[acyl-carrier-protein] synthase II
MGVIAGSSRGPVGKVAEGFDRLKQRRYPPSLSADCTFAALSGVLAQSLGLEGPTAMISATCASGAYALALAAEQLLLGKADAFLVGAAEAPLLPAVVAQLEAAGVLGSHTDPALACRPFDQTRNGLCLGEGGAFLVLETAAGAKQRGAAALAQLSGWGLCLADSGRAGVSESGGGTVKAAREALAMAGLSAAEIGYVNTHGTGTRLNDAAEAKALRQLFDGVGSPPCSSTKPVTGHCLGATPALEVVICIEALRRQVIPPTLTCHQLDPECGLNVQPLRAATAHFRHAMSNSLGFWGYHASLIFSTLP